MKYIFLDVDGTLYSSALGAVPRSAQEAIKAARANGAKVFLCTGRSLAECMQYLNDDLDGYVFAAGAMIYADKKRIYDRPMPSEDVKMLGRFLEHYRMGWTKEGQAGAYCSETAYEFLLPYFAGGETTRSVMVQQSMENGCYPADYMDPEEKIYKVCGFKSGFGTDFERMKKEVPDPYSVLVTMQDERGEGCEITDSHITKATGIARVLDYYGACMADAVAVGDSENDIPMLEACGTGIAMGNAFESVKRVADWVTTDIMDDGIWNAFEHIGVL